MLQYLHINNWFDISQSLRLAAIWVIFPEGWYKFLFLTFSYAFSIPTLFLSSQSFKSHSISSKLIIQHILSVCVCLHIFMCISASMNPLIVCINAYICLCIISFQCVFWCIVPHLTVLLVHVCAHMWSVCVRSHYVVCLLINSITPPYSL